MSNAEMFNRLCNGLLLDAWREKLDTQLLHRMPPPSWEDMETLYCLAFNAEPPRPRKRCERCGGEGHPFGEDWDCPRCNGSGFEE